MERFAVMLALFGIVGGVALFLVGFVVADEVSNLAGVAVSVAGGVVILLGVIVFLLAEIFKQLRAIHLLVLKSLIAEALPKPPPPPLR